MFRLTLRTAFANLRSRPLNSFLLGVIIAGGAMSLALASGLHANASDPFKQTARATNSGDVHVLAWDGRVSTSWITHLPGVRQVSGPYRFASVVVPGRRENSHLTLEAMQARPALERPELTAGRWVGPAPGEVVLERSFARARQIHVGDWVRIRQSAHLQRLRVVGVAISAARSPFPKFDPAAAWVGRSTLAAVQPNSAARGRELHLRLADRSRSGAVVTAIQRHFRPEQVDAYDWREVQADVTSDTSGLTVILGSASLIALLAAGFVIANAISGRVLASRREIGLLKAAGFTPGGVTGLFVAENVILALIAGVIGTAAAVPVTPLLLKRSAELLGTPTPSGFGVTPIAAGVLGVVAIVAIFTVLPAWHAGRLKVLDAIKLGRTSVTSRPSRMAELATRLHLPVPAVVGVKDAFAARSRAVMTILSLILTVTAVVATLGTEATYRRVVEDSSLRAKPYDLLVASDSPAARTSALLAPHRSEFSNPITIAGMPAKSPGSGLDIMARALGGDYRARPYAIRQGRMLTGPGETIVGRGLLDKLHLHVGQRLRIEAMGNMLDLRIVGRYIEPDNNAVAAIFDQRSLPPAAQQRLRPDFGLTVPTVPGARRLQAELLRDSHGALDPTVTEDDVKQERDSVRPIIWGMDVLLLSIGLVNLVTTMMLGIRERRRDFAIFKSIGLTPRQVLGAVTAGGSLLTLIAVGIGVPVGAVLFRAVVIATNPTDGPDLATTPTWWWLLLIVPGMLIFTTLAGLLPARRAAEVQPAEALRYE